MNRFQDKIALITGGTSGMGLATARRLLAEGAQVVITGRDSARLAAAAESLDNPVTTVVSDTGNLSDIDRLMATIRERYGRLDVVFANAGIGTFAPSAEITEADFDRTVDANFKGLFFTIQKAVPLMGEGAAIVINSSWTINRGLPVASIYSATKAAVHNLARTLASDLGPKGIRVNSISPGYIATAMSAESMGADGLRTAAAETVAGRLGESDEIAAAVAFLAGPDASYVNGQDLIVDGGLLGAVPSA